MTPTTPSTRRMALLLAGLAMFGPFSIDTIFPAFSRLSRSLAVDEVAIQQTISVYLLAYGLMSIAHGPLSDAWGRKRVILGGLVLFIAGSVGCALSQDLPTLLAFRALQGLSAGVGMIVGRAVIRDLFLDEDLAYAAALTAAGVPVDLRVVPAAFHAFDGIAPQAPASRAFTTAWIARLAAAIG